jgi:hypothetical protein
MENAEGGNVHETGSDLARLLIVAQLKMREELPER